MTIKEIFKILNSHDWKEEESQVALHILDHWKTCYLEGKNAYKKKLYTVCLYLFANNYTYEEAPVDEAKKTLDWTFKKYKEDKNYLKRKYREFAEISSRIKKISTEIKNKGLAGFSNKALKNLFNKVNKLGKDQYGYSLLPEGIDTLTEQDYSNYLPNVGEKDISEIVRILGAPGELSFLEKEKISLLKLALEVFKDRRLKRAVAEKSIEKVKKFPLFFKKLGKHTRDYFWIQNSFRGAVYLESKYFLKSLADLIKSKTTVNLRQELKSLINKKRLVKSRINKGFSSLSSENKTSKKYELSSEAKSFFELLRSFSLMQDSRKEDIQKLVFSIDRILSEIERRFKIPQKELENYFVSEVIEILKNGKRVPEKILRKRKKAVFFSYLEEDKIKTDVLFGKEADRVFNFFKEKKEKIASQGIIKGFVASMGRGEKIVEGRVRIVFDPVRDVFQDGEILVSGMTRPEFVSLMKKARAVITNEGGITTHAAIVSREFKIPCIIGTKIATDVLKNGDLARLDLSAGIVKILKKANEHRRNNQKR